MRVVHFSDLHGYLLTIPPADLYICTGDVLPNFPDLWEIKKLRKDTYFGPFYTPFRVINSELEGGLQYNWMIENPIREFLGNPDAPIIYVRGNHDFTDLIVWGELGENYEIHNSNDVIDICSLKIGGFRGVPPISGEWSDEIPEEELENRCKNLPKDLDIVVTHSPPNGILDRDNGIWGSKAYRRLVNWWSYYDEYKKPKLAAFGHIHASKGQCELDGIVFSNASTGYNIIDLKD